MKRAALYLRVSTIDQTTANQERELRQVAERAGWEVDKVYKDHGISGSKGRDKRPAFDALPTTLSASDSDGGPATIEFTRVIVMPDGHRHIESKTPKQLPAPSPLSAENNDQLICVEKPSQNSASDDQ